jgi:hypothetical protein
VGLPDRRTSAVTMHDSTDCFVTRCWIDSPKGVELGGRTGVAPIRPRVGANDFYGTTATPQTDDCGNVHFVCNGKTAATQDKAVGALVYQNFLSQLQDEQGTGMCFYAGEGVDKNPPDHSQPYDLNLTGRNPVTGVVATAGFTTT